MSTANTNVLDLSPTADTKMHVVSIWEDKPHFECAQCSAVVVSVPSFDDLYPLSSYTIKLKYMLILWYHI